MRRVLVESPFAGRKPTEGQFRGETQHNDAAYNRDYLRALLSYLTRHGDAPYASHLFFTQFLDDTIPEERTLGIEAGLVWGVCAQVTIVGVDRGISRGMRYGIERARSEGRAVEWLSLPAWRDSWLPAGVERAAWQELARPEDRVLAPVVGVSPL